MLSQTGSAKAGDLATKFTFQEIGADNRPLGDPRTFTVRGDIVYFDAWVVKYEDRLVESGDPLRSMSICLFRRIFGESQEPGTVSSSTRSARHPPRIAWAGR